ncbi:unnamed protein product, partial [Effrenium voratum]
MLPQFIECVGKKLDRMSELQDLQELVTEMENKRKQYTELYNKLLKEQEVSMLDLLLHQWWVEVKEIGLIFVRPGDSAEAFPARRFATSAAARTGMISVKMLHGGMNVMHTYHIGFGVDFCASIIMWLANFGHFGHEGKIDDWLREAPDNGIIDTMRYTVSQCNVFFRTLHKHGNFIPPADKDKAMCAGND